MINKQIKLDMNSAISELSYEIKIENNIPFVYVSFRNVAKSTMTAIKFLAKGYNSFGDIININGKDNFLIMLQDLSIYTDKSIKPIKIQLPNAEIRTIELLENQYCFADGTIKTYLEPDYIEYEIEEYDTNVENERLVLNSLKEIQPQTKNKPIQLEKYWVCSCGKLNDTEDLYCLNCKVGKEEVFSVQNEKKIEDLIAEHKQKEEERTIQREKNKKQNIIKFSIIGIVSFIFLCLIINACILGGRTTYSSVEEMKDDLQGTYTYYSSGKASRQIVISGNKAIYKWSYSGSEDMETDIREWNYKRGIIHTFEDLIITKNGDLKDGGDIFEKGGYMSTSSSSTSSSSSSYSYESKYSALKISNVSLTSNSSYTVCTGTITNKGKKNYSFVEVKGAFKNSSGTVLDTDWTYAVGSEGLAPGESKTFRMSVPKNYSISSCSVSIMD